MPVIKEDNSQIGQMVQFLRKDRSQRWLAEATGTTVPIVSNIENGKRPIPKKKIEKFAAVLGVKGSALVPRQVTAESLQDDLQEMGLAFRGLKDLPDEARDQLTIYYRALRERYLEDDTVVKKSAPELASTVLQGCGIKKPAVDLDKIVIKQGIRLERDTFNGIEADGFIICSPNKEFAAIKIRAGLPPGRERFTIAHELGHYFANDGLETQMNCSPGRPGDKSRERFADEFASHLLMPRKWFKKALPKKFNNVQVLKKLGKTFGVSLEAASISLAEVYPKDCAIFVADGGKISWFSLSKSLYSKVGAWPKGTQLVEQTQVSRILKTGNAPEKAESTKAEYWFRQRVGGKFKESSMGTYGQKTLSLIWRE